MPINNDKTYSRIWQLADQFSKASQIKRSDLDLDLNDIRDAVSTLSVRTNDIEAASIQPSGNAILNPEFAINTLNYQGEVLALDEYAHNRWKSGTVNTTYTTVNDLVTITAGSIKQLIDGRSIITGTYTISWVGTATCSIDGVNVSNPDTVDLTDGSDVLVEFSNGNFAYPYLTIGSASLQYRSRPYEQEFQLCRAVLAFPFDTAVTTAFIHESIVAFSSFGETAIAQGNRRVFKRVASDPGAVVKIQSADGAWWEYVPPSISGSSEEARITSLEGQMAAQIARIDSNVSAITSGEVRLSALEAMQIATLNNAAIFQDDLRTNGVFSVGASTGGHSNIEMYDGNSDTFRTIQWRNAENGFFMEAEDGSLYRVWHAGSDGAGSGLDADLLDGVDSSQFLRSDVEDQMNGRLFLRNTAQDEQLRVTTGEAVLQPSITIYQNNEQRLVLQARTDRTVLTHQQGAELHLREDGVAQVDSSPIWHTGNDGAGSGLDADAVDGLHADQFLRSDVDDQMNGRLIIANSSSEEHLRITNSDVLFEPFLSIYQNGAQRVYLQARIDRTVLAHQQGAELHLREDGVAQVDSFPIWHTGNDGAGSGLDADAVDGLHADQFLRSDVDDVGTGLTLTTLRLTGINEATLASTGHAFQIGADGDQNLAFDRNEITARNNGGIADLGLQGYGGNVTINGTLAWHLGNDGAGSGLDADAVDGLHADQFLRSDVDDVGTNLTLGKLRLTSTGDVSISSTDHAFQIGADTAINVVIDGNEIMARNNGGTNTLALQLEGGNVTINGALAWHSGNDGAGSGLDADAVDGLHADQFLRSDVDDQMDGNLTVGGLLTCNEFFEVSRPGSPLQARFGHDIGSTVDTYIEFYRGGLDRAGYIQALSDNFRIGRDGGGTLAIYGSGDVRLSGSKIITEGTIASNVQDVFANIQPGSVGTTVFCKVNSGAPLVYGDQISGSNLQPSNSDNVGSGSSPFGFFRCMGTITANGQSTEFLRIA